MDERFNEDVCGIVNSLIKLIHHLKTEDEWQAWYNGLDDTFVLLEILKMVIRTPDDLFYSIQTVSYKWKRMANKL